MSELKAHYFLTPDEVEIGDWAKIAKTTALQYYLKSEADKVIAELKAQKAQAEDDCAYWKMREGNAVNAMHETEEYAMQLYRSDRHQKYKRCMAMTRWCEMGISYWDDDEQEGGWEYKKLRHCIRWHKRWLEIAEKFKEEK